MEADFELGWSLPIKRLDADTLEKVKNAFKKVNNPGYKLGRTAYVHTRYVHPPDPSHPTGAWTVEAGSLGVIKKYSATHHAAAITSEGRGTFPVPLSNIFIGADLYDGCLVPMAGRHCKLLQAFDGQPKDTRCFIVTTMAQGLMVRAENDQKNAQRDIPGALIDIGAPPDAADGKGRMVRAKVYASGSIDENTEGYVENKTTDGMQVKVRTLKGVLHTTSANEWNYGQVRDKLTFKVPEARLPPFAAINVIADDRLSGMRKHGTFLLSYISRFGSELEGISKAHLSLFNNAQKAQNLGKCLRDGIKLASPALLEVLERQSFTIADVFAAGKDVGPSEPANISPGVYIRGYSKFKSEERKNDRSWPYTGMAEDMDNRDGEHTSVENSTTQKQTALHYVVARDATERRVVQVFQLPSDFQNLPGKDSKRTLEVIELMFTLFLHTLHSSLCKWEVDGSSAMNPSSPDDMKVVPLQSAEAYILQNAGWRQMASALSKIAAKSFESSGWKVTRAMLGTQQGLNLVCQIDSRHDDDSYRKTVWSSSIVRIPATATAPIRRVRLIRRNQQKLRYIGKEDETRYWPVIQINRNGHQVPLYMDPEELKRNGPLPGTDFWTQVEIYDDGEHPCPAVRAPRGMPISIIKYLLRIGVTIFWLDRGRMMQRNVTCMMSTQGNYVVPGKSPVQGATYEVAKLMSVVSHLEGHDLVGTDNQGWPTWIENLGKATVAQTTLTNYTQVVDLEYKLPGDFKRHVHADKQHSRRVMQELGLRNIGGTFGKVDKKGLAGTKLHPKARVGAPSHAVRDRYQDRDDCDRCFAWNELIQHTDGENEIRCDRSVGDFRKTCHHCHKAGFECSWTPSEVLLQGLTEHDDKVRPKLLRSGLNVEEMPQFQLDLISALLFHTTKNLIQATKSNYSAVTFLSIDPEEEIAKAVAAEMMGATAEDLF